MQTRRRAYIRLHLLLLLFFVAFCAYALLMRALFPGGYFDCLLGDALRLYCPLCGGTRALLSLLSGDLGAALRYNFAVMAAIPVALLFELRALCLLWQRSQKPFLPRALYPITVAYLIAWMLVRNTAMLLGVDPTGDHAVFWAERITPARAWLALVLGVLLALSAWGAILPPRAFRHLQGASVWTASMLPFTLFAVLLGKTWILLLNIVVIIGIFAIKIGINLKRRNETV